jgi:nicotinamidase-related amidase
MSQLLPALQPENSVLLVVDIQDRLLPAIHEADACVEAARRMIEAARVLNVPALCTEQYPLGLGRTCAIIRKAIADSPIIEKTRFSSCVETLVSRLRDLDRSSVIVVGIEAHVCVQQTVLDLLRLGFRPCVCADAVGSRRPLDRDMALERMRQAGAIVTTTESVIFELLGEAGTDAFRSVLKIVK